MAGILDAQAGGTSRKTVNTPQGLTVRAISQNEVSLSWSVSGTKSYISIERAPSAAGPFAVIYNTALGVRSYNDQSVSEGYSYAYRVRAYAYTPQLVYSAYSTTAVVTVGRKAAYGSVNVITDLSRSPTDATVGTNFSCYPGQTVDIYVHPSINYPGINPSNPGNWPELVPLIGKMVQINSSRWPTSSSGPGNTYSVPFIDYSIADRSGMPGAKKNRSGYYAYGLPVVGPFPFSCTTLTVSTPLGTFSLNGMFQAYMNHYFPSNDPAVGNEGGMTFYTDSNGTGYVAPGDYAPSLNDLSLLIFYGLLSP